MVIQYTPPSVSGYFPQDLFNAGARQNPAGLQRLGPNFQARVVKRTDEGEIIYWRAVLEDWRGGLNITGGRFDETYDRVQEGDADGRFFRYGILPHLTTTQSSPVPSGTFTGLHSVMYDDLIHISAGSVSPATEDFVTSATEQAVAQVYRITGWHGTEAPDVGTAATGSSTTPNPPTVTGSWGEANNLFIAAYGADVNAFSVSSTAPTDYSNDSVVQSNSASAAGVALVSARREEADDDDDPGTFTLDSSEEWVAQTVVIRPSAGTSSAPVAGADETTNFTSSTTHNLEMPATVGAGDLLLVMMYYYGVSTTGNTPSGWTKISSNTMTDDLSKGAAVFAKIADGTEDGTTVNFSTSSSCRARGTSFAVSNWYGSLSGVEASSWFEGSSDPNPPAITHSWGTSAASMFVTFVTQAIDTYDGTNSTDIDDDPAGYTTINGGTVNASASGVSFSTSAAYRTATVASEDPGPANAPTLPSDDTMAVTIAIRGATTSSSFPAVASITETVFASDATAHDVTLPASNSGDLLVCFFVNDGNATVTTPSGWTQLHSTDNTAVRLSTYYKISDGTDSGSGALFRETSTTDPTLILTQYNPGDSVTGLDTIVIGGATEAQRIVVSRLTTAAQVLAADYTVAGSMHADTTGAWGFIQTFTNDDLVLIYANGTISSLAKTAAITDQPTVLLDNVPNGGFTMGMARLGGAPMRAHMVWPYEDQSASMLAFGSERPGRVVSINAEGTDYQEVPMGIKDVYNAILVGGYAVAAHNKKRLMFYDGTGPAQDLLWLSDRGEHDADATFELRGMFANGNEIWVEVISKNRPGETNNNTHRHWETYNLDTNAWHVVSGHQNLNDTGDKCILPSGELPFSTSTRYLFSFTEDDWRRIYVPFPNYNPFKDINAEHEYEAAATYHSPEWELPGLEGWPKIISRILFMGDVDAGGDGAYVTVRCGGQEATFLPGLEDRSQIVSYHDHGELFYKLDVEVEIGRTTSVTTETPNALPIAIEGYAFVGSSELPPWLEDIR